MRNIRRLLSGLVYLFVFLQFYVIEATATPLKVDVQEFFLSNGMQFLVVERRTTPQVSCRVAIRAGSALEEVGKTGIAHMLEHIMFKGTKNFGTLDYERDQALQSQIEAAYQVILEEQSKRNPDTELIRKKQAEMEALRLEVQKIYVAQAFSSQLGKNGAVGVNAFTTKDQTQYLMSVPSDMMEQWFSIVSEQLFEPSWREFYVEKEVVQREWAFRYINNPAGAAWLDLDATAYTAHPYRNPTIGWKSDMERYNTQDAGAFHRKYYTPTNAVCVLVGNITVEEAKRLAGIYFERYPAGTRAPEKLTQEPLQQGPRKSVRYLKGARTPVVRIGYHAAQMGSDDFYALDAMTMILSHGAGARLTQRVTNEGLAVEAWAYNPDNRYGGMVVFGGSPNEPEALKQAGIAEEEQRRIYLEACEALDAVLISEAEKLKIELVSRRELDRIRKLNRRDFLDRMRSNESLAGTLATLEVELGWRYLIDYLDRIDAVTPEEIRRVANAYVRTENKTSVYIIPGGKPDQPPESYTEIRSLGSSAAEKIVVPDTFANHSLYPTPIGWRHPLSFDRQPKKIQYPPPVTTAVENVPVFYLPDAELPLIDLTLLFKAGAVDVDESRAGLSRILDQMLIRGGTESFSPSELAMVLDENAVRLSVSIGEEETAVHLSVMEGDWKTGLKLLEDILLRPRLDPAVLKVVKAQETTALQRQGEDAQAVSVREAAIWQFQGHPYGRDPLQGLQSIPALTEEDLKAFLKRYIVPSNMVVTVSGAIDKEAALEGVRNLLRSFPKTAAPSRELSEPAETPPVLIFIHKPGQVQAQISLGLRSVRRTHPDFWKINLLMNIFGGNDSLMYQRLRDDLGLVYAAYFYQTYKWNAGILRGYIGCKVDKTAEAVSETLNIMEALHREVPEKILELKRLDTLNSFVFNVDSPAELVTVYGRYHLRQEPLDTLDRIQEVYMTTSKGELERLAGEFLNAGKIQIMIVADKTIPVKKDGQTLTLEADVEALAEKLGLPYREIGLR